MKKITSLFLFTILSAFVGFAQGSQDFETQTALTNFYEDGSFTEDGITYNYVRCRNEGLGTAEDYSIGSTKGIILRRISDNSHLEWTIPNGIGTLSFDVRKAFTGGSANRQVEVLVNGTSVFTTPTFGLGGTDTTVHSFSVPINQQGSTTIRIKIGGTVTSNRQVTIDNIVWTEYVAPTDYCVPTGFALSSAYYISAFNTTGSLSEYLDFNYSTGTGTAYYENLPHSGPTVVPNSSFTISMTQNTGTGNFYAWVDWNNNFSFYDPGEAVFETTSLSNNATATINVPSDISNGAYRIRIANSQFGATSACGPADYGGFVDFYIFVDTNPVCSGVPDAGTVTVTPTNGDAGSTYDVTASGYSANSGLLFLWEKSTDNGDSWDLVSMTRFYQPIIEEIAPQNNGDSVQYRLTVVCAISGEETESNVATFTTGAPPPTCSPITSLNTSDITTTSVAVTWTAGGTETTWNLEYGPVGFSQGNGTTINGVTNPYTITGLTAGTSYDVFMQADCGSGNESAWVMTSFTTDDTVSYCVPSYTNNDDYTSAFSTSVNGTTFANYTASSQTGIAGYNDLSSDSSYNTSVVVGGTFTFSHTFWGSFSNGNTVRIWVDWNNNGVFEDDEEEYNEYSTNTIQSSEISVPTTIPVGDYRMRVRSRWGNVTPEACSSEAYGQALDMTIVATALNTCSGTPNAGTVTVTPSETAQGEQYNVTAFGFDVNLGLTFQWEKSTDGGTTWEEVGTSSSFYQALNGEIAPAFGNSIQYRLKVTCDIGGTAYSSEASFTAGYCVPSYTNSSDYTAAFSTSVNGTTFVNYTASNQTGIAGYNNLSDDDSYNTTVGLGETVNFSHTYDDGSQLLVMHTVRIWVDWNNNGVFEDSEEVANQYSTVGTQVGSFVIVATQTLGEYRIRVRTRYGDNGVNACASHTYGQALDMTLVVACPVITAPTGETEQTFESGETIANLDVTGDNLVWYSNNTYTDTLSDSEPLVNGATYYVVNQIGSCMSDPLIINVTETVNRYDFDLFGFSYYPNPVNDILTFSFNQPIENVVVSNLLGQTMDVNKNSDNKNLDMANLPTGNYLVKITIEGVSKTIKVVKN